MFISSMESISEAVSTLGEEVQEMSDRSGQVGMIVETIEDEIDQTRGILNSKLRVHKIQKKEELEPWITIEITQKTIGAFSIKPINLNRRDALRLISMLEQAAK